MIENTDIVSRYFKDLYPFYIKIITCINMNFFQKIFLTKAWKMMKNITATDGSDGICMKIQMYLNIPFQQLCDNILQTTRS